MSIKFDSSPTLGLQKKLGQQTSLTQRMIMSAHMQQAIHLLQLPLQELEPFIEQQVVQNPILEIGESEEESEEIPGEDERDRNDQIEEFETELTLDDADLSILSRLDEDWREHFSGSEAPPVKNTAEDDRLKAYEEQSVCCEPNLRDQLLCESRETFEDREELEIAEIIIGYIDRFGYLKTPVQEIALFHDLPEESIRSVLKVIQTFHPFGVGASSIRDSLLIQLNCLGKSRSLAYKIIEEHYDDLLHNQIPSIRKHFKCTYEEIRRAIDDDIAKLDLHPGTVFSSAPSRGLVPDVTLRQENDLLIVEVEREYSPVLKLNRRYLKMLEDPDTPAETKQFIKRHLFSARWLMRNLHHRYSTLERIARSLAVRQREFFIKPDGGLTPLTMRELADELDVHESTIARTVSNKYLFSPRGLLPLRTFFTNKYKSTEGKDISSTTIKDSIMDFVNAENKSRPLSDEKISNLLKERGMTCARRTVAKYRLMLGIGNTQQRKKFESP